MTGGAVVQGGPGDYTRHKGDFYETPPDVTHALLDRLTLPAGTRIWEPACGRGAMAKVLQERGHRVVATDLFDYGYGAHGVDFTTSTYRAALFFAGGKNEWINPSDLWVITNPPFSLTGEFITRALTAGYNLALLLSNQFWHAKKHRQLFERTRPRFVLPLTWRPVFASDRGNRPVLNFAWTVWQQDHLGPCEYCPLPRPIEDRPSLGGAAKEPPKDAGGSRTSA